MSDSDVSKVLHPLNDQQVGQLQQISANMSSSQLAWTSGYFWALSQTSQGQAAGSTAVVNASSSQGNEFKLAIIYASQTGNAKGVATQLLNKAQAAGVNAVLYDAADYKPKQLTKETHLAIVASTNGEGEAPDNALIFHEFLQSKKAPKLENLNYAVLGLGDSSYEFFCQTGKDFDAFLSKLGAKAMLERVDCDLDYEQSAQAWSEKLIDYLKANAVASSAVTTSANLTTTASASQWSKQNPYRAQLSVSQKITGRDSDKTVHHVEIDIEGSGLTYQPGDALGVWYKNDDDLVKEILALVGLSGVESVDVNGESLSIHTALLEHFEITASNPMLVKKYAELSKSPQLLKLVEDSAKLREYSANTQVIDVLQTAPMELTAEQLTGLLRSLTPRLYSIASSQAEVEDEVHLTVALVEYSQDEKLRFGGASHFLTRDLDEGDEVKVFIESNAHFKLPADDNTPIIMIGPGTGIAPFRSFIQEREAREATGKNWLLFGDRTFTQDFLYQVEWQNYLKSGLLTRIDLAFSRDQEQKIYVQDRLKENAAEVWQWLQQGAHIYVCGDATRMAKDVENTLIEIVQNQGDMSQEQAQQFIQQLRKDKRYQKDVY